MNNFVNGSKTTIFNFKQECPFENGEECASIKLKNYKTHGKELMNGSIHTRCIIYVTFCIIFCFVSHFLFFFYLRCCTLRCFDYVLVAFIY